LNGHIGHGCTANADKMNGMHAVFDHLEILFVKSIKAGFGKHKIDIKELAKIIIMALPPYAEPQVQK